MKRIVFFAVALFATMTAMAQSIAVVSPSNTTTIFQTLDDAIAGADPGSTIYLPGGGFQINSDTQIDKKLTIMGVSHRGDTDNADGATIISGNVTFKSGSSGSSLIGVYVSGSVKVGINASEIIDNVTLRHCNIGSVILPNNQKINGNIRGLVVNQCYVRYLSDFGYCNARLENNIMHAVRYVEGGIINHNVILFNDPDNHPYALVRVGSSSITNNIIKWNADSNTKLWNNNYMSNNCFENKTCSFGENPIILEDEGMTLDDLFVKNNGIAISSDFHFKEDITTCKGQATDGTDIGIYGGSGFSDKAVAPIPRIVSKKIAEQTDESGKLRIEVTVKAQ